MISCHNSPYGSIFGKKGQVARGIEKAPTGTHGFSLLSILTKGRETSKIILYDFMLKGLTGYDFCV